MWLKLREEQRREEKGVGRGEERRIEEKEEAEVGVRREGKGTFLITTYIYTGLDETASILEIM